MGFNDNRSYYPAWYISRYCDVSPYRESLLFTQEGSYDDSYCSTYEEVDNLDYPSLSWYTNGSSDQDYGPGTWLGDYKFYFGGFWGEDEVYGDGGRDEYGNSLGKEEEIYGGEKYENFFGNNDEMELDYSENQLSYFDFDFGEDGKEDFRYSETQETDPYYSSSWDNMKEMNLYESIFGHWSSPMNAGDRVQLLKWNG